MSQKLTRRASEFLFGKEILEKFRKGQLTRGRILSEFLFGTETLKGYKQQVRRGLLSEQDYKTKLFDLIGCRLVSDAFTALSLFTFYAPDILDSGNPDPRIGWAVLFGSATLIGSEGIRGYFGGQMRREAYRGLETQTRTYEMPVGKLAVA